jgi:hypothetical protein
MIAAYPWTFRARTERFVGRLPRRIAYPLIFIISLILWCAIAILVANLWSAIAAFLR